MNIIFIAEWNLFLGCVKNSSKKWIPFRGDTLHCFFTLCQKVPSLLSSGDIHFVFHLFTSPFPAVLHWEVSWDNNKARRTFVVQVLNTGILCWYFRNMCSELIFYRIADFFCIYMGLSTLSRCSFDKYLIFFLFCLLES